MQTRFSFFAGIDVSKNKLDVCLLQQHQALSLQGSFCNTLEGLKQLNKWIALHVGQKDHVLFCMEHTGIYTLPLCLFLSKHAYCFAMVPALEIKRSIGVKRGKSDSIDARSIARYAQLRKDTITLCQLPEKRLLQLKHLLAHRSLLVKLRQALQVSMKEREDFVPKQIISTLTQQSTQLIKNINQKVHNTEAQILSLIHEDEQINKLYGLLLSLPGIGPVIAVQLLVQTRLFTLFESAGKFACYSGIAPFEHSSGSRLKGIPRVSHLANKKIKALLNLAVLTALKKDYQLRAYYNRKVAEGKNKMLVLNNLRNKLVHRIFATIRRGTPYVLTMQYAA